MYRVCCLRVCLWFHRVFTLNCCYYWFLMCATCKLFSIVSFDLFLLVDSLLLGVLCLLLESLLWRPVESPTLLESLVDRSGWVLSFMKWMDGVSYGSSRTWSQVGSAWSQTWLFELLACQVGAQMCSLCECGVESNVDVDFQYVWCDIFKSPYFSWKCMFGLW